MKVFIISLLLILMPMQINAIGTEGIKKVVITHEKALETYDFNIDSMLNNDYVPWEKEPTNEVEFKEYIYFKESSFGYLNITDSVHMQNEDSGAYGICQIVSGEDKPYLGGYGDVLNSADSQDFACTRYMHEEYGTWENAYKHWINNKNW